MKCKKCGHELRFRFLNGRANPENIGMRSGVKILKLLCHKCGEKWLCNDDKYAHPYQTHPRRLAAEDVTQVYAVRLSRREVQDVEIGKAHLTISDNRLQLLYNT